MHLLDINILIAISDPQHAHHQRARTWFLSAECDAWATCPLTENGFIRILGQPSYPAFGGGPEDARSVLEALVNYPGHQFWPDDQSFLDRGSFPDLPASRHLTDLYLLAMAVGRQGKFATLDQRIDPGLVSGGSKALIVVP